MLPRQGNVLEEKCAAPLLPRHSNRETASRCGIGPSSSTTEGATVAMKMIYNVLIFSL
jgi:hypothetical protein